MTNRAYTQTDRQTDRLSDKQEFAAIDVCRLVFAVLVVALHLNPFTDISPQAEYMVGEIFARLAVPFFFLTSGFFFQKKLGDPRAVKKYLLRILKMYLLYLAAHIPMEFYGDIKTGVLSASHVGLFLRKIVFTGYCQFWYLLGLLIATGMLYLLASRWKMKDGVLLGCAVVLYGLGVLGNVYFRTAGVQLGKVPWREMSQLGFKMVIGAYYKVFETTRSGLFFGFPLMTAGYLLGKYREKIVRRNYGLYFAASMVLVLVETWVVYRFFRYYSKDMLFSFFPASVLCFLMIAFADGHRFQKLAKPCRRLSVLCYGLHILCSWLGSAVAKRILHTTSNNFLVFLLTLALTFLCSAVIMRLSRTKPFRWMKLLY